MALILLIYESRYEGRCLMWRLLLVCSFISWNLGLAENEPHSNPSSALGSQRQEGGTTDSGTTQPLDACKVSRPPSKGVTLPEESKTEPPKTEPPKAEPPKATQIVDKGCFVGGCSGQLCGKEGDPDASTCEYLPQYACYASGHCKKAEDGTCGWEQTPELKACFKEKKQPQIGDKVI